MDEQVIETATGLGYVEIVEGTGAGCKTPMRHILPASSAPAASGAAMAPASEVSRKRRRSMPGR